MGPAQPPKYRALSRRRLDARRLCFSVSVHDSLVRIRTCLCRLASRSARRDQSEWTPGVSLRHRRASSFLVISEVGLALVLLVGTGLLLKSFRRMTSIDLGFDVKN